MWEGRIQLFGLFKKREKTAETAATTGVAWRRKLTGVFRRRNIGPEFWEELEEVLISSDVGFNTAVQLVETVRDRTNETGAGNSEEIFDVFRDTVVEILGRHAEVDPLPDDRPVVLLVVGVNGVGKTTSIAKLAKSAKDEGREVILAAADTFRAGAIEQLKAWGERIGVPVVAQQAGSDPGAVAFDAMSAARSRNSDLVIIDTAGRLHTSNNLMQELKKVRNIVDRQAEGFEQRVLLVIDGTTGQNGLLQAQAFIDAVRCDGVMLTKLDGTARGGVALAIAGDLKLPIWFIGTGESVEDLSAFDPAGFADAILPELAAN